MELSSGPKVTVAAHVGVTTIGCIAVTTRHCSEAAAAEL